MDNGMIHPKFEEKIQKVLSVLLYFRTISSTG